MAFMASALFVISTNANPLGWPVSRSGYWPRPEQRTRADAQSPARSHLIANCVEPQLVRKMRDYGTLSLTARRREVARGVVLSVMAASATPLHHHTRCREARRATIMG